MASETKQSSGTVINYPYQVLWCTDVIRDHRDKIVENIPNCKVIMSADPRWEGVFAYNEMQRRVFVHRETPWDQGGERITPRPLNDLDVERTQAWFQKQGGMWMVSKDTIWAAIRQYAEGHTYHPIRDWLKGLKWDGVERLSTWLPTYCHTADIPYTRAIGRMALIGMVRRVMHPGSKMDYMLILEGPQGIGKSTVTKILAGEEYFGEAHFKDLDSVDVSIFLKNKWVVEFGELHAMRKAEINELKLWLTKQVEDYRPKYGRENVIEPRQCVFYGTCNNTEYLNDPTGARRFWPVYSKAIEIARLTEDREQLMAEAFLAMEAGEPCHPDRDFELKHFLPQQMARKSEDPWAEFIEPLLKVHNSLSLDVICQKLRLERSRLDRIAQSRIKDILTSHGWEYKRTEKSRLWVKPDKIVLAPAPEYPLEPTWD